MSFDMSLLAGIRGCALGNTSSPSLTASEEMGKSVLHPQGSEFREPLEGP